MLTADSYLDYHYVIDYRIEDTGYVYPIISYHKEIPLEIKARLSVFCGLTHIFINKADLMAFVADWPEERIQCVNKQLSELA
jgi:hypothetical protein